MGQQMTKLYVYTDNSCMINIYMDYIVSSKA